MRQYRRKKKRISVKKLFFRFIGFIVIGVAYLLYIIYGEEQKGKDIYSTYNTPDSSYIELNYSPSKSVFSVWAPKADEVRLLLYKAGHGGHADQMIRMVQDKKTGVWSVTVPSDLAGLFYTFNAKYETVWRGDSPGLMPHAVGVNGERAAILSSESTNPVGWDKDKFDRELCFKSPLFYTLHIHKFSADNTTQLADSMRGTYLGVVHEGDTLRGGIPQTFDHLKELGVNYLKVMPLVDMRSVDESRDRLAQFDWGFSTVNYTVPEGSYCSNPFDPSRRILEFKQMVQKLHQAGIGVVLDFSFALSYRAMQSNFERLVPNYFFYQDEERRRGLLCYDKNLYPVATERPFVSFFIERVLRHWIEEYHIDGFSLQNIDLYDPLVLDQVVKNIKRDYPNLFIAGHYSQWASISDVSKLDSIAYLSAESVYFQNDLLADSLKIEGFLQRQKRNIAYLKLAVVGGVKHDGINDSLIDRNNIVYNSYPWQCVNRLSSYKSQAIVDLCGEYSNSKSEGARLSKLAYTTLLTSQGVPEIYSGDEVLQSNEQPKDRVPKLNWKLKVRNLDFYNYLCQLIKLRKGHPAFSMANRELLNRHLEFLETTDPLTLAYRLKDNANGDEWEDIIVVLNASRNSTKVALPQGRYIVVVQDGVAHEAGLNYVYEQLYVSPQSATVIYRSDRDVIAPPKVVKSVTKKNNKSKKSVLKPKKELMRPERVNLNLNLTPVKQEAENVINDLNNLKIDN